MVKQYRNLEKNFPMSLLLRDVVLLGTIIVSISLAYASLKADNEVFKAFTAKQDRINEKLADMGADHDSRITRVETFIGVQGRATPLPASPTVIVASSESRPVTQTVTVEGDKPQPTQTPEPNPTPSPLPFIPILPSLPPLITLSVKYFMRG